MKNGFLYLIEDNNIKVIEGSCYPRERNPGMGFFSTSTKSYRCSGYEGIVNNGCIWYSKRNDEEALNKVIHYLQTQANVDNARALHYTQRAVEFNNLRDQLEAEKRTITCA